MNSNKLLRCENIETLSISVHEASFPTVSLDCDMITYIVDICSHVVAMFSHFVYVAMQHHSHSLKQPWAEREHVQHTPLRQTTCAIQRTIIVLKLSPFLSTDL